MPDIHDVLISKCFYKTAHGYLPYIAICTFSCPHSFNVLAGLLAQKHTQIDEEKLSPFCEMLMVPTL